mmetsp:Transcript_9297/g.13776  ORF Transcript_9297/g.13776 Transcript_9297/m.13776 type:complete len:340 (+) Transcript_9297:161-1180(+)|eukprot:CAMPEP_0196814452 /NCGR_PEP_ID=MMETSP1362-20130617/43301_1 /TAXON_ID=163516 /ORGANISM="Leptocylindrus danicus, Strain CCMP1856" /LENGTH=339 /DNA_ID=CAMNT_0042191063 /DNA_START=122 /DNA_END=1141 /DNA_ORIENTATION=-
MASHERAFSCIEEGNSLLDDKKTLLKAIECFLEASDILRQLSADDKRVAKLYESQSELYKSKSRELFIDHINDEGVLHSGQLEKRGELFAILFNDGYGVVTKQEHRPPLTLEERLTSLSSSIGKAPAKYSAASKDEELRARLDSLRSTPLGSEKERLASVKDGLAKMGIKTGVDVKNIMNSEPLSSEDEVDLIIAQAHDEAEFDKGYQRKESNLLQDHGENDCGDDQELSNILRGQGITDGYIDDVDDSSLASQTEEEEEEVSVSATNGLLESLSVGKREQHTGDQSNGLKTMISNAQSLLLQAYVQCDEINDKARLKELLFDAKVAMEAALDEVEASK